MPVPPGGIRLQENLYMDETELTNVHWLEYLYHLQKDSSAARYTAALPDTSVWEEMDVTGYMKKNYLRSPEFRFYPVVGISYEQMQNYCIWRSAAASAAFNANPKNKKKYKLQAYEVVFRYRLPTAAEWELAAAQGKRGKWQNKTKATGAVAYSIIDSLGNNRPDKQKDLSLYLAQHPDTAVNCLKKFDEGFYYGQLRPERVHPSAEKKPEGGNGHYPHLLGNVAEMTLQKGVAKGGSWAHRLEQVSVTKVNAYVAPAAWLGARCIGEVYRIPRAETPKSAFQKEKK
ncbi:formylglycine-generating enzyme family protein [Pontibacter sp. HJ8]